MKLGTLQSQDHVRLSFCDNFLYGFKAARRAARAANAASLALAASCQPVPVTFSSRAGSCPVNVAELL